MNQSKPSFLESLIVFIITIAILCIFLEIFLVFKNKDGKNYDIEMWRYSRELKQIAQNSKIGHEHLPSKTANLQNTELRINSLGMRGGEPDLGKKQILILGSSITLGWGVPEEDIYPELIARKLGSDYTVLNAGIGNYNSYREIEAFFTKYQELNPKVIVLSYFVNDAEIIPAPKRNWLLEHSQLAFTLWTKLNQLKTQIGLSKNYDDYYKSIYEEDYQGWLDTQEAFKRLADYALAHNIKIVVTMIPDTHNLNDYPFLFIHDKIKNLSQENGFVYIDFYDSLKTVSKQEELWAMPGDPHPNGLGHKLMAEQLYEELEALL